MRLSPGRLAEAQRLCRGITEANGRTYALATRLLTPGRRRAVWALYAWARVVDDVVDGPGAADPAAAAGRVRALHAGLRAFLGDPRGDLSGIEPGGREWLVLGAAAHEIRRWGIDPSLIDDFVASMLMDVPGAAEHRDRYADWAQLADYMWGSAAVIGLQLLPVLGTRVPAAEAAPHAVALGEAFQVTNFLRDVAEDLDRGRIYLPMAEWAAFGVDEAMLADCAARGAATAEVVAAMRHFAAVNRAQYRRADPGVAMLTAPGRQTVRTARVLYGGILDRLAEQGHDPFAGRAAVPPARRLATALPQAAAASAAVAGSAAGRGLGRLGALLRG